MRPRQVSEMLRYTRIFTLVVVLTLQSLPLTARAQQEPTVFVLPIASVLNLYQVNIEQILRARGII